MNDTIERLIEYAEDACVLCLLREVIASDTPSLTLAENLDDDLLAFWPYLSTEARVIAVLFADRLELDGLRDCE